VTDGALLAAASAGYCDEDAAEAGGVRQSCIVYPLMAGGDLEHRLRLAAAVQSAAAGAGEAQPQPAPLTWWERLRIFVEIFQGLVDLHDPATGGGLAGHPGLPGPLFHRDVKTANVLLDAQLTAFLGDFGLARAMPGLTASDATGRTHVSTANLIGTHQYMAPEYLSDGEISNKTDVYSCGAPPSMRTPSGYSYTTKSATPALNSRALSCVRFGSESEVCRVLQKPCRGGWAGAAHRPAFAAWR
jgi:serine/threonine protein kinase